MKFTYLTLAGLMATTVAATPFWERHHEDRYDDRHCRPRTVVQTKWKARTTTTRTKYSTRTKTVTERNHWNHRPRVVTTTKLRTVTSSASAGTFTVTGNPLTSTVTIPGEGEITTVTIPTTVTLPQTTITIHGEDVTTTVTVPGDEVTTTVTIPGDEVTNTVETTITSPTVSTTTETVTVPGDEVTTTVTIPGDEVTNTVETTITSPTVSTTTETVTVPGVEVTTTVTTPGDEVTNTIETTITSPTVSTTTETVTLPGDNLTITTTLTEATTSTIEGPTKTITVTDSRFSCAAPISTTLNLLSNPGFESPLDTDNWTLTSLNERSFAKRIADIGNPTGHGIQLRIDTADGPTVTPFPQGNRPAIYMSQTIAVCPGATYTIRLDSKQLVDAGLGTNASAGLIFVISDGTTTRSIVNFIQSANGVWRSALYVTTFTAGVGQYSIEFMVGILSTNWNTQFGTREIHVDNVMVMRTA